MTTNAHTPLSAEELAELRRLYAEWREIDQGPRPSTWDDSRWGRLFHEVNEAARDALPRLLAQIERLNAENATLRRIAVDLQWMSKRYADDRQSYAPSLVNDHTRTLQAIGVELNPTADGTIWAHQGGSLGGDAERSEAEVTIEHLGKQVRRQAAVVAAAREWMASYRAMEADGILTMRQIDQEKPDLLCDVPSGLAYLASEASLFSAVAALDGEEVTM